MSQFAGSDGLDGKTVLVTGGTGSFGQRFAESVLDRFDVAKLVIFSRDELKQHDMASRVPFAGRRDVMRWFIGDVRDDARLHKAMEDVDVVVHAAAMKQVPAAEYNPFEAVKTNIMGAENVINASLAAGVSRVVALSTDKAAAPINVYGATKLASDKLFVAANNHRGKRDIRFSVVRYGNVMASRGSVIPFFRERATTEGVLPITDERMTRFTITLQHAVDFVIESLDRMWGGELFVPKIPSYRILDLAEAVAPGVDIKVVGIRPGEKLHEEMITVTDAMSTVEFDRYFVILPSTELFDTDRFQLESGPDPGRRVDYGFRYDSGTNDDFLDPAQLRDLIAREVDA